jgi:hypothetical protein
MEDTMMGTKTFFLATAAVVSTATLLVASGTMQREQAMTRHATGTFDVTVTQAGTDDKAAGIGLGRWLLEKRVHGDLEASGKGEMLTAATDSGDAKAYVAIERITGTLDGRAGSFVFMHSATLTPDGQRLTITVMPGSGTGALTGLTGTMTIRVEDKVHRYDFDYALSQLR